MRNSYLYITLLSILGFNGETCGQAIAQATRTATNYDKVVGEAPRLVVTIGVEGLRTDCLEQYSQAYTDDGLRRLLLQGRMYGHGMFPFVPVDRASATASMATGAVPYYNGITGVEWMNRETLRPESIVSDGKYGLSPRLLASSTIGDELKIATEGRGRVYGIAENAVCAILSAGHAADGAVWMADGRWTTTAYYEPADAWTGRFVRTYAPQSDVNMSIVQAALHCLEQTNLGADAEADLLCVTLHGGSGLEAMLSVDNAVSFLLNGVTRRVPLEQVLFVVCGTGETDDEERRGDPARWRIPTGRFQMDRTAGLLNLYLGAVYGAGQYVETTYGNQLYVNRQLLAKKNIDLGDVLRRSQEFLLQLAGVRNVYSASQLMVSESAEARRVRNGYNVERCGDLLVEIQPGWQLVNEERGAWQVSRLGTVAFPIVFLGAGVEAGRVDAPVTADRVAPTVARCIRIRAPNACGVAPLF